MNMKALEIQNLQKSYGKSSVIKGLNLIIEEGEVFGLIGPNGAGKSTLVKLILNLIKKDSGEIIFFENKLENFAAEVGATIEEPSFYGYMTGKENLDIYKNLLNLTDDDVYSAMEMTGIRQASDKKVSAYSMGMKQRLAISRAVLSKPKLLILDEPTNGLDPKAIIELRDIVHQLNELGTTIIFCSHNLSEVKHICNTYGFLNEGMIKFKKEMGDSDGQLDEMESLFL
ncbi:MAG: ATP-binding cassette domain-containing protein [Christensenellaceae bacterium]|nr:ATP-binding cassette domain-containing protein [Christensenellaceae bacterium]